MKIQYADRPLKNSKNDTLTRLVRARIDQRVAAVVADLPILNSAHLESIATSIANFAVLLLTRRKVEDLRNEGKRSHIFYRRVLTTHEP